jgi:DNA-binding beta-propeller fold protein YncE
MRSSRPSAAATVAVLLLAGFGCTSDPLRRSELPGRPSAITVLRDRVWVADDEAHVVRAFGAGSTLRLGDPIPVPRNPVALAAGSDAIWVGHAGGEVTRIDARTRRTKTLEAGGSITGIAVRGSRVWAADLATKSLVEIDARTNALRRVYRLNQGVVRVTTAGDALWVTNSERTVTRVDARTHAVGRPVPTGLGPIGLAFDGRRIWVANSDDGTVSRIEVSSGRPAGRPVRVGRGPVAVAAFNGSVWVANQDDRTLVRIDADGGRVVGDPISLSSSPRAVAAGEDAVWVVGTNPSRLVRVDL